MDLIPNKMLGREEVKSMYIYASTFVLLARMETLAEGSHGGGQEDEEGGGG